MRLAWWRFRYVLARSRLWWTADGRLALRYGLHIGLHVPRAVRAARARARR